MGYVKSIIPVGKKKVQLTLFFLFETKLRSTTSLKTFKNLHIFFNFAEFTTWENERRKVSIQIFAIRMGDKPNSLAIILKC